MTLDATVITAIGSALLAVMTGVGLVLGGMNSSRKKREAELDAALLAERVAHAATRAELAVSHRETDSARDKQDEIREAKDKVISRLEAEREADRLAHETERNRLKGQLGGAT